MSFKVHKKNLAFHSFVFRKMFEVGTSQDLDEVSLTETSKVLEIVVGFCYPDCASPVPGDGQELVELARACHKYDVSQITFSGVSNSLADPANAANLVWWARSYAGWRRWRPKWSQYCQRPSARQRASADLFTFA